MRRPGVGRSSIDWQRAGIRHRTPNRTSMRMRLAILACALAAGGSPAASAHAASDGGPYRVQMIYRTGKSLAPFKITVSATSNNGRATWFATEVHREGKGWAVGTAGPLAGRGGAVLPMVYGVPGASSVPTCPGAPAQVCDYPVSTGAGLRWEVKPVATSRYYVVSAYMDGMKVDLATKGWRVKDVVGLGARRVFPNSASAVGANVWGTSVEHFTAATAPGGRYGSLAYASLPCGHTGQGGAEVTARGAQEIGGDMDPEPLRCGLQTTGASWNFFYTSAHTTWRLTGDATGIGYDPTRLLVFDFPKP